MLFFKSFNIQVLYLLNMVLSSARMIAHMVDECVHLYMTMLTEYYSKDKSIRSSQILNFVEIIIWQLANMEQGHIMTTVSLGNYFVLFCNILNCFIILCHIILYCLSLYIVFIDDIFE